VEAFKYIIHILITQRPHAACGYCQNVMMCIADTFLFLSFMSIIREMETGTVVMKIISVACNWVSSVPIECSSVGWRVGGGGVGIIE
jgi:hypothetical protein